MFRNYLSQNVLILSLLLTSFCHTLSPFKQPAWVAAATVSEKTKAARIENRWIPPKLTPHEANLLSPKKTSSKYRANESRACSYYAECSRYYATPHRWHRHLRYTLHRLREISVSRRFFYQCFRRYLINAYTFWAMRWNDFALANAVLRAVPYGHSRKSLHRRAIVNGAKVSTERLQSLSQGKNFLPFSCISNKCLLTLQT